MNDDLLRLAYWFLSGFLGFLCSRYIKCRKKSLIASFVLFVLVSVFYFHVKS